MNAAARDGDERRATAELRRLAERTPAWTVPTFCVAFCNVIRGHHETEDSVVFPLLVEYADGRDDGLAHAIEKLKADHRELAAYLDRAQEVVSAPAAATRSHAGRILDDLATKLTEHLDDEERRIVPALNALSRATPGRPVPPTTARHLHGFSPG